MPDSGIHRILFATDLQPGVESAFALGLKLALVNRGRLTAFHVATGQHGIDWTALPTARDLLVRWKLLEPSATVADYERLGIEVHPRAIRAQRAADEVVTAGDEHDLVILGAKHRDAVERMMGQSTSDPVVRRTRSLALVVPDGSRDLVDVATGKARLNRVVVPVGEGLDEQNAIDAALAIGLALGVPRVSGTIVHTGGRDTMPELDLSRGGWAWTVDVRSGGPVGATVAAASETDADLIVLATHGHGVLDSLRGGFAERMIHEARCPVLVVPTAP
jgi:nucleotide-binding universal stress UspA family protein